MLLNLASVCNTEDKSVIWHFISRYSPDASPENAPNLDRLVEYAVNYFRDFVQPAKQYRAPSEEEKAALIDLRAALEALPNEMTAADIQTQVYEIGKRDAFKDLRAWFQALYELLLGQSEGPRMGSFIALYGVPETIALIDKVLAGEDLAA